MERPVIHIRYCVMDKVDDIRPQQWLEDLPHVISEEIMRYRKHDDRVRLTAGKLLLRKLLEDLGYGAAAIEGYHADENGKPLIDGCIPFNITHSGSIVAVAAYAASAVGIDVEKIRRIVPEHFDKQFSPPEMQQILAAEDPTERFFDFWTQKEAVMKADGRGMRIPLHAIRLRGNIATVDDRDTVWSLKKIVLHPGYKSHICLPEPIPEIDLRLEAPFE